MAGMKYRILGKTGLNVSVIGIGTWQFGGEWGHDYTQEEVSGILSRGRELGINLIDTAECYGDHVSENLIGGAIQGARQDWVVATKFGHKYHGMLDRTEPRMPADVQTQLEESLRALRTDYIDIHQYHSWGDEQFFNDDVQAVLEKALAAGKVRHLGNSVRGAGDPVPQIEASERKKIEVIQIVYNRLDRRPEGNAFDECERQNLGVLARVPLASGYLSGKYKSGAKFEEGDVRSKSKQEDRDAKITEARRIQREEVPAGVDMAQWALAWCLKNPAVSAVIPGCKNVGQVESNAGAAKLVE
jgi:aryl-alcohol dehydrogenase-like predicted oxidoreductase